MYERFAGGGHFAGVRVTRGYSNPTKRPEQKDEKGAATPTRSSTQDTEKGSSSDDLSKTDPQDDQGRAKPTGTEDEEGEIVPESETRRLNLERQMSNLVSSITPEDPAKQEEEIRKRNEREIQNDYVQGDDQGREIEHLILVTHGIGQRLGLRLESVNFVHDVNTFRKTLKSVYSSAPDLQALNAELDAETKNSRVQVLPICWRHLLDFPKQSLKHNRREHDLGDIDFDSEDEDYPSLDDITVDGVPAVRNLITDLALDILLYQSPAYKGHITRVVLGECNRIYSLFKERNPAFSGKVSLIGHSLGSAIMFDIMCKQPSDRSPSHKDPHNHGRSKRSETHLKLNFPVEDFYALGSPIGLFQMLKGRTITSRQGLHLPAETPTDPSDSDPFLSTSDLASSTSSKTNKPQSLIELSTSSPKCARLFNIFHPTDPISYRIEPLISSAMATLKPQPLPYTKKGIFGAPVGQGLTGIGARVGQSVSGLWSSFSTGLASSLLNRSLGISAEQERLNAQQQGQQGQQSRTPLSLGAGTNIAAGTAPGGFVPSDAVGIVAGDEKARRVAQASITAGEEGLHPPTLIDAEMETLFAGFEQRRRSQQSEGLVGSAESVGGSGEKVGTGEWDREDLEEQARRLRREEGKVRALNGNGRVDYSIQE